MPEIPRFRRGEQRITVPWFTGTQCAPTFDGCHSSGFAVTRQLTGCYGRMLDCWFQFIAGTCATRSDSLACRDFSPDSGESQLYLATVLPLESMYRCWGPLKGTTVRPSENGHNPPVTLRATLPLRSMYLHP